MSQQPLLLRCKQTIETLNDIIATQKIDIERLQSDNKQLYQEINTLTQSKIQLMEQISKLKKKAQKIRGDRINELHKLQKMLIEANTEVESHKVITLDLEKRVRQNQNQLQQRDKKEKQAIQKWEQSMKQLQKRIIILQQSNNPVQTVRNKQQKNDNYHLNYFPSNKSSYQPSVTFNLPKNNECKQYIQMIKTLQNRNQQLIQIIADLDNAVNNYKLKLNRAQLENIDLCQKIQDRAIFKNRIESYRDIVS